MKKFDATGNQIDVGDTIIYIERVAGSCYEVCDYCLNNGIVKKIEDERLLVSVYDGFLECLEYDHVCVIKKGDKDNE